MKRRLLFLCVCYFMAALSQAQPGPEVPPGGKRISDQLFGLFFEDINYASDGGLYAELVQNRSFEYSPSMQGHWHPFSFWEFLKPGFSIGDLRVATNEPLHPNNPTYVILDAEYVGDYAAYEGLAGVGLKNVGYNGMPIKAGAAYNFSVFARQMSKDPVGFVVQLRSGNDEVLAEDSFKVSADRWQKYEGHLSVGADCDSASLVILAQNKGRVALDMVSLFPEETFMGRRNGMRADLARSIAALQPRFLRFPGGCLVHGDGLGNMYRGKYSVGPVEQRKAQRNIWGYQQSHGLGFFEYFQFCEDIGARAVPVLPAGVSCQNSGGTHVIGGAGQKALCLTDMDAYIQDVLDLIEWATGPADSEWGAVRVAAGREAPFELEFLGIGNEDKITPEFEQRFTMIYEAVRAAYPHIKLIATSGPFSDGEDFEKGWDLARKLDADLVDEHYYKGPEWMLSNLHRYDAYDRSGPKVYLGEYASWGNRIYNAVAEAAYMVGLERNADVVSMASYAPLMARKGNTQWSTDMLFFDDEQLVLTPNYHVQKMFMTNQGDWYYDDVVSCKQKDSLLAVSTVYDSSTGDVIIKLVNAGSKVHEVKANLSAFKHLGDQVQGTVLKGVADDENTFAHPNKIAPEDFVTTLSNKRTLTHTVAPMSVTVLRIAAVRRFANPLIPRRADPQIVRAEDGAWYFIATAPDFDRILLRKAETLEGLAQAEEVEVWHRHTEGPMTYNIWAPELHRVDGQWYIYFAAGHSEDRWRIRMFALSNPHSDPTMGTWKEEGRIETRRDAFALDATVFEHQGEHYYVWAERTGPDINSGILIAKMDGPVRLMDKQVVISEPEFLWERQGYNVNEGPAVLKRNGKVFITYSGSATDHNYAMGLLWADEKADLLDPASWNKRSEPVFYSNDRLRRFGPGHNSFVADEDGESVLMIYHARDYKEIHGHSLGDPNRDTRVRPVYWDQEGFPDFGQELAD